MIISPDTVSRACLAIRSTGNVSEAEFEKHYHCKFTWIPNDYLVEFDDEKSATEFILRFT